MFRSMSPNFPRLEAGVEPKPCGQLLVGSFYFVPGAVESELTWTTMLAWVVSSQSFSRVYVHRPGK